MNISVAGTVFRKELREIVRDRRSLISMIIVPLLFDAMGSFLNAQTNAAKTAAVTIGVTSESSLGNAAQVLRNAGFHLIAKPDLRRAVEEKQIAIGLQAGSSSSGNIEHRILED